MHIETVCESIWCGLSFFVCVVLDCIFIFVVVSVFRSGNSLTICPFRYRWHIVYESYLLSFLNYFDLQKNDFSSSTGTPLISLFITMVVESVTFDKNAG